jgi:hypothetical protein
MSTPACADEAMREQIGFLVLGRLSADEHRAVTAHLAGCAACRDERDQVDGVVAALGMLAVADVRDLVAEFGLPERSAPAGDQLFGAPGAPRPKPVDPPRSKPGPAPARPARDVRRIGEGYLPPRPATGPLARGPHTHRPSRTRRRRTVTVSALAGVAVLVLSTVLLLNPWTAGEHLGPVVAVAVAKDESSGVDVSATVYDEDGRASVRLTAEGLGLGVYQLYAVPRSGSDLLLGRLSGAAGKNTFAGDIPVPAADLWYFSVRQVDGPLMIVATLTQGSTAPR